MIDGLKFSIDPQCVSNSDVLEFRRIDDERKEAKCRGLTIKLYPKSCYVRGSIHKYKNNGVHNTDDFPLSVFVETLRDLAATLNMNPEVIPLTNFEFGVNIELHFDAQKFINSIVYYNSGSYSNNEKGVTISFFEWDIKIYLKEIECREQAANNILRFEISINKMRKIRSMIKNEGVFCSTLADLANSTLWRILGDELLNIFDNMLIVDRDSIDIKGLNEKEINLYINGGVPSYWTKKWDKRMTKKRELAKFNELIKKHSTSTMKEDVRCLIFDKINSLIDIQDVTISPFGKDEKCYDFTIWENSNEDKKMLRFHHLGNEKDEAKKDAKCYDFPTWITGEIVTNPIPENSLCEITGLPLKIGKKRTSYLGVKDVEIYYKNHPEIYVEKLKVRLSKKWENEDLQIQFREIAHSIRNEKFNPKNNPRNNPRNNFKRDFKKMKNKAGGRFIFEINDMIKNDKLIYL